MKDELPPSYEVATAAEGQVSIPVEPHSVTCPPTYETGELPPTVIPVEEGHWALSKNLICRRFSSFLTS